MNVIKWVKNEIPKTDASREMEIMSPENVRTARSFHKSFPQYMETPLVELKQLAKLFKIEDIFVKDEAWRFGLHAFKVLGGSYAIARYIAKETGRDISDMDYETLTSDELREEFGQATFFSATDGNHGRGVAWAAGKLGQKSVILMPKGSSQPRLENILKEGATASIEDANYDECVRRVAWMAAETKHGVVIQDTAWDGYEEIPAWIMQGYGTMAIEADEQMSRLDANPPTHIFVQAGVGSLAGAMVGYFANKYRDNPPVMVVVEADQADCLYRSALAADGKPRSVGGDMQTIMAGLACGEPNITSWEILKNHVKVFVSCPDWVSARGMRILGMPVRGDQVIISGESGAVTTGLLAYVMMDDNLKRLREDIGLDEKSRVLMFSTEGNTDPHNYRHILWDGGCIPSL